MSDKITVELPAIDEALIERIDKTRIEAFDNECQALATLRERYAPLARHNGFVKVKYQSLGENGEESFYLLDSAGEQIRAFRCLAEFCTRVDPSDSDRGTFAGYRLYLTELGQWIQLERYGDWSKWANEEDVWSSTVTTLTDMEVATRFELTDIIKGLSEALQKLANDLPGRLVKVQQRAKLAAELLTALKESK
jgi:hypothetical protein